MALLTIKGVKRKLEKVSLNQSATDFEINKDKFCNTAKDAKTLFEAGSLITKNKIVKLIFVLALVCVEALQKKMGCE